MRRPHHEHAGLVLSVNDVAVLYRLHGGIKIKVRELSGLNTRQIKEVTREMGHLEDEVSEIFGIAVGNRQHLMVVHHILSKTRLPTIPCRVVDPSYSAVVCLGSHPFLNLRLPTPELRRQILTKVYRGV
jgi:hypothetical protein